MEIFSAEDLARVITLKNTVEAVEAAFYDYNQGDIVLGGRLTAPCGQPGDSSLILPATHTGKQYYGFKQATTFAGNTQKGLPTVLSQYLLYSNVTGELLSIMDFLDMTNFKTGAAAAIATKYLALPHAHVVGVIGSGTLSRSVLAAICQVREIKEVKVFDLNEEQAKAFAAHARKSLNVRCEVAGSSRECVRNSHILCTCTTSPRPVLDGDDLLPGCHINAMGSYKIDMQELDEKTVKRAALIATDIPEDTAAEAGDLVCLADKSDIVPLDAIMGGQQKGRGSDSDITIYESIGFSVLDLALAVLAHEKCSSD
ncbi:ornithine cyclodeaminase/alanine dehydrogenase [Desulfocicer vacuolatum DSM 3385]|uniref:Ornithine cyclodeaminase/alanine dehydrogenase n=1 Tax=Desulfocicer vacuolatum DSM 3385 TaxID=1121400 RepID=A0A1W2AUR6_9BACT|nr:ornithine cyclodeaminase family protein [Desulfocicer vacuolatum]SMC64354.1 ornithine cyclodeaminase/alanine dehydrogenase [Desulfocicer vacuolatum DSM 3385]